MLEVTNMKGMVGRSTSMKMLTKEQLAKRARHREHTQNKSVMQEGV